MKKHLVLGASSDLAKEWQIQAQAKSKSDEFIQMSRSDSKAYDFTREENWLPLIQEIQMISPTHLIYFSGGGPYGEFGKGSWDSHLWAFKLNLLFPAFLIHNGLNFSFLKQMVFIGSQVAENHGDMKAASYAAGKSGLRGLIQSVQKEKPLLDVRLFSPGYVDTKMLPKNAWPRQQGLVASRADIASELLRWMDNPEFANQNLEYVGKKA